MDIAACEEWGFSQPSENFFTQLKVTAEGTAYHDWVWS